MKKTLIISALLTGVLSAHSQGTIAFTDREGDMNIHVYAPQGNGTAEVTGNANGATSISADQYEQTAANGYTGVAIGTIVTGGSTVYSAASLIGDTSASAPGGATQAGAYNYNNGNDYTVELYAASGFNAAATALQPVSQYVSTLTTSSTVGGTFKPATPTPDAGIPNTLPSGQATIALVVWYNGGVSPIGLSQEQLSAQYAASPVKGESLLDNLGALGGSGAPPNTATAPDLLGLQSFSLVTTPEPSTIALGVIGASAFLFRRRKIS